MPRPKSKDELLKAIAKERGALEAYLETLTPEQMVEPDVVGEWSPKDVLAYLIEWEQMVLSWYRAGLRGEVPELPALGYKWNQTPALNRAIYEKHRDRALDDVLAQFHASHHGGLFRLRHQQPLSVGQEGDSQGVSEEELVVYQGCVNGISY